MSDLPKLVRDRIPDSIRGRGAHPVTRFVAGDELKGWLFKKLREEVGELERSPYDDGWIEELGDVIEVIRALASHMGIDLDDVERYRTMKLEMMGGFTHGIILERILEDASSDVK